MQGLTKRQQMVLEFITLSISDRGYPPTLREIGSHMGIRSTNGVNDHLRALERKGYLKREDMKSRALRPVNLEMNPEVNNVVEVPVVGRVAAGEPVLAEQNIEETISVDRYFIGRQRDVFALKVHGDSMIDAGINEGDTILVRKQLHANRNEIAVVLIGDEATVKYYQPERDFIRLQPANDAYAPIIVRKEDFLPTQILGVVVGLYRKF
ncbi:MAG: transcriptional repressor LexA [Deltaproteobacteria bacterium]|nr:transcriptional repressor LexA [Deltaproteobacteria bacterium]